MNSDIERQDTERELADGVLRGKMLPFELQVGDRVRWPEDEPEEHMEHRAPGHVRTIKPASDLGTVVDDGGRLHIVWDRGQASGEYELVAEGRKPIIVLDIDPVSPWGVTHDVVVEFVHRRPYPEDNQQRGAEALERLRRSIERAERAYQKRTA